MFVEMATHKSMGAPGNTGATFGNWPSSWSKIDATLVWSHDGYLGVVNYLVIDHGDGTFATYWHLSENGLKVKVGDKVERGDWIAVSGNTGNSSTPVTRALRSHRVSNPLPYQAAAVLKCCTSSLVAMKAGSISCSHLRRQS